ncbi:unnamed protein product [Symbiodinium natans]|uniref:Uncharacterized protein n=1 Tax=Symbiodinium natans TaxID=878477 RepID=A0A812U9J1_9DINO|nr:unnamed protein product [Symbiodinium natans]
MSREDHGTPGPRSATSTSLAAAPAAQLGDGLLGDREPFEGSLGDLLKSQLVEMGNFVGGLKLRKEAPPPEPPDLDSWAEWEWHARSPPTQEALRSLDANLSDLLPALKPRDLQSASPLSSKSHATSFHSPSSGLAYELEVLRLQIAALAQSLAGLGACVMNWSAGLVSSRRQELADMVLRYTLPCEHLSRELKELCRDLRSMELFSEEPSLSHANLKEDRGEKAIEKPLTLGALQQMLLQQKQRQAQCAEELHQEPTSSAIDESLELERIRWSMEREAARMEDWERNHRRGITGTVGEHPKDSQQTSVHSVRGTHGTPASDSFDWATAGGRIVF